MSRSNNQLSLQLGLRACVRERRPQFGYWLFGRTQMTSSALVMSRKAVRARYALRQNPNTYDNGRTIAYGNSFPNTIGEWQMDQPRKER
jgi:hypothetical protein